MLIVRPVELSDLPALERLASISGIGLTTLPPDSKLLRKRIRNSLDAFAKVADDLEAPAGEAYLFVLQDTHLDAVVGVCAIYSKTGGYEPFYAYRIEDETFSSTQLDIHKIVPTLKLIEDHNGPSEIGSLFLHPDYRRSGNGRFLQLVRFLFVAERPHLFEPTLISEIRGVCDDQGNSPFWDAVGRHFFGIDFSRADRLSVFNKRFIAELMPDHPIYISMLPESARSVIGKPHPDSARAMQNLMAEGFSFANAVDIFDAGPCLSCPRDQIRTVRESRQAIFAGTIEGPVHSAPFMICSGGNTFRACVGGLLIEPPDRIRLAVDVAAALGLSPGDKVRHAPLHPAAAPRDS
jgi:arginine N-succinyltransferase